MTLQPPVARTLYRALMRAAATFDTQLLRCPSLRAREVDGLQAAATTAVPRNLRPLLHVAPSDEMASPPAAQPLEQQQPQATPESNRASADKFQWGSQSQSQSQSGITQPPSVLLTGGTQGYIASYARRLAKMTLIPPLHALDGKVGFAMLRHLNGRVHTLQTLVYNTRSAADRFGIHVAAQSIYQGSENNRHVFRYNVRITNASQRTIKLLSRAWTIRDLDGRVSVVEGPGVVGAFPILAPRDKYEYSSAVPLQTPVGTQSGHFMFVDLLEPQLQNPQPGVERILQVPVAPFSHRTPSMDDDHVELPPSQLSSPSQSVKAMRRKKRNDEARRR